MLVPRKGRFGLVDYEKAYTPDLKNGPDIFDLRCIDRERAMIVVRPDQHVANVLPLDAYDALAHQLRHLHARPALSLIGAETAPTRHAVRPVTMSS